MPDIAIHDLADFPHWLPVIADWFYTSWRELYGEKTQAEVEQCIAGWLGRDRIPTALVAVADDEVIGIVALKDKDQQFGILPWLSGLYVVPARRHCGVGTRLLRAAENKARSIGLSKLYLYTQKSEAFYGAYGWQVHQHVSLSQTKVSVMEKMLTPHNLFQHPPPALRG